MTMTPADVRRQQFRRKLRGYDPEEVSAYIDLVATGLEESHKREQEFRDKLIELETQLKDYKSVDKALQQTLMQAQETSGKAIENARKEAQLVIQEAELKASQIVNRARNDLTALKEQITILKAKRDSIVSRLRVLLNSELDLIKALEADGELQDGSTDENKQVISKERMEIEEIIKSLE